MQWGIVYVEFFMLKTLKLLNFSYARAGEQHRMTINQLVRNSEVNNSDINKILWDFSLLNSLICSMCGFGREMLWKKFSRFAHHSTMVPLTSLQMTYVCFQIHSSQASRSSSLFRIFFGNLKPFSLHAGKKKFGYKCV